MDADDGFKTVKIGIISSETSGTNKINDVDELNKMKPAVVSTLNDETVKDSVTHSPKILPIERAETDIISSVSGSVNTSNPSKLEEGKGNEEIEGSVCGLPDGYVPPSIKIARENYELSLPRRVRDTMQPTGYRLGNPGELP